MDSQARYTLGIAGARPLGERNQGHKGAVRGRARTPATRVKLRLRPVCLAPDGRPMPVQFLQGSTRWGAGGAGADVFGIVAAWGEVELHETGFRAEYARPHVLLLPPNAGDGYAERLRALAAGHGAEVWEVDPDTHCTAAASRRTAA
jgi:hypothetical protein